MNNIIIATIISITAAAAAAAATSTNCNYRIAATLCTLETWVVSGI